MLLFKEIIMKQEDKDLLVKDLCARLPYGVMVREDTIVYDGQDTTTSRIKKLFCDHIGRGFSRIKGFVRDYEYQYIPYLFPLSSMTEEQKQEYSYIVNYLSPDDTDNWKEGEFVYVEQMSQLMHFFYRNHLDFRGLIEQGLANDATGLNIYKL